MALAVSSDFDGGNIEVVAIDGVRADLRIRKDTQAGWSQWFYFRVDGEIGQPLTLTLKDVNQCSYPDGWDNYRARVSENGEVWRQCDTRYENGDLIISYRPQTPVVWFAYFAPYGLNRQEELLHRAVGAGAKLDIIGHSTEGRPISRLRFGSGPKKVWFLGRQHAGETMASWWMDGAVAHLMKTDDPTVTELLSKATIYLVPLVNVDGAFHGNLRANAAGLDLNRQWHIPPENAPEVAAVLKAMDDTGVDFMMDVHGDEAIPHVFIDGCDIDVKSTPAQKTGCQDYYAALLKASPAFQTTYGYPPSFGGDDAPTICARAVPRRYGCVGMTLEMPFKDSLDASDPEQGWSTQASADLGAACLKALNEVI
jgi:murein tripeptide amidase MpaA